MDNYNNDQMIDNKNWCNRQREIDIFMPHMVNMLTY